MSSHFFKARISLASLFVALCLMACESKMGMTGSSAQTESAPSESLATQSSGETLPVEEAPSNPENLPGELKCQSAEAPVPSGTHVKICHIPPGNPEAAHSIVIGYPALSTHVEHHGDYLMSCQDLSVGPCDPNGANAD
jgi:hypothetical protein